MEKLNRGSGKVAEWQGGRVACYHITLQPLYFATLQPLNHEHTNTQNQNLHRLHAQV